MVVVVVRKERSKEGRKGEKGRLYEWMRKRERKVYLGVWRQYLLFIIVFPFSVSPGEEDPGSE